MPRTPSRKKRADGNYQRSITIGYKPDGRPMRKTFYAKTIRELDAAVAEYERKMKHGLLSSDEKMTFGELAKIWIESYKTNVSTKTRNTYKSMLELHLLPHLGHVKLTDLKPHNLQSILNSMECSTKLMRDVKLVASQILEIAVDNDVLVRNVFKKVTIPEGTKTERRALTPDEVKLIASTYQGHRMGIPALIMLYCGLRRGELIALTWRDVDIANARITVNKAVSFDVNAPQVKEPKTESGNRVIPIPRVVCDVLPTRPKSLFVCPSAKGEMMTNTAFKCAWRSYMRYLNIQAGGRDASRSNPKVQAVDHITPHMLRHTYATMLYDSGVDVKSAQKFLGHADLQITLKIYTHLSKQKEDQAIEALNIHIGAL